MLLAPCTYFHILLLLGLLGLTSQYVLSYLCSVGRYQYGNIVTISPYPVIAAGLEPDYTCTTAEPWCL